MALVTSDPALPHALEATPHVDLLEVNWGGGLNLAQFATGEGVLDPVYGAQLRRCSYGLR